MKITRTDVIGQNGNDGEHYADKAATLMDESQWQALCHIRNLRSAERQATPSAKALKAVLVDGLAKADAARLYGITRQAVNEALVKARAALAVARALVTYRGEI